MTAGPGRIGVGSEGGGSWDVSAGGVIDAVTGRPREAAIPA